VRVAGLRGRSYQPPISGRVPPRSPLTCVLLSGHHCRQQNVYKYKRERKKAEMAAGGASIAVSNQVGYYVP